MGVPTLLGLVVLFLLRRRRIEALG
jgi:MYXO-CTERM domain-containing protein